jgi:hypothetical protein
MKLRVIFGIGAFLTVVFFPWWVSLIVFMFGSYLFAPWYEILLICLIVDLFLSAPRELWSNFHFVYTTIALILVTVVPFLKKRILNLS